MSTKRLTQPMRQVLKNLIDGQPIAAGLTVCNNRDVMVTSIAGALRKRGFLAMQADATYKITPQGRSAYEQSVRSVQ